jgi:hypothetical protein
MEQTRFVFYSIGSSSWPSLSLGLESMCLSIYFLSLQKASAPISIIFASTSQISSIDWSVVDSSQFVTTDHSTKVKVFV